MHLNRPARLRRNGRDGSLLVVVLIVMLIVGITTAALLTAASAEGRAVVTAEKEAKLAFFAQSGLTYGRFVMGFDSEIDATWNGHLARKVLVNGWYSTDRSFQVYVTVQDNDDGDGDPFYDTDGEVFLTGVAYGPTGVSAGFSELVRRQKFDQYLFAIGTGNLAAPAGFVSTGPIRVNGEIRIVGEPVVFTADVATSGGVKYMAGTDEDSVTWGGSLEEGVSTITFPTLGTSQWDDMATAARAGNGLFFEDGNDRMLDFRNGRIEVYLWEGSAWVRENSYPQSEIEIIYSKTKSIAKGRFFLRGEVGDGKQGKEASNITVIAEKDVYIFGSLTYTNKSTDVLGILAGNNVWLETRSSTANRGYFLGDSTVIMAAIYAAGTMKVTSAGSSYSGFTYYGSLSLAYLQLGDTTGVETVWGQSAGKQYFLFDTALSVKQLPWMPKIPNSAPGEFGLWRRLDPDEIPARPALIDLPPVF